LQHLEACRREARCNQRVLDAFLFGARRMELIGQRMLDGFEAAQLYAQAVEAPTHQDALAQIEKLVRQNRNAHEALGQQFALLWSSESKPYALDWTLRRYTNAVHEYDALLGKLLSARAAAAAGQPLPSPEEIGLAFPKPLSRCMRPRQVLSTPLLPDAAWADATATHRLGLVIQAGAADRFDLPVQVELTVPDDLAGKPVRAFLRAADGSPREVLAQLDALDQRGKSRLVVMLPGALPKGTEAFVHVYLGLMQSPPVLPGAVTTSSASNGMQWIQNDRVRLLLGGEGAHVYRWEVKALGNRDLTMPGETGWAGFGDIGGRRDSQYRLHCASRGPALVEYRCNDASGHTKSFSLYGGASWIEILLSEPTSIYWDFDDPKNFAADGPAPGTWLFSNGQSGAVGREADGVPAQVKAPGTSSVNVPGQVPVINRHRSRAQASNAKLEPANMREDRPSDEQQDRQDDPETGTQPDGAGRDRVQATSSDTGVSRRADGREGFGSPGAGSGGKSVGCGRSRSRCNTTRIRPAWAPVAFGASFLPASVRRGPTPAQSRRTQTGFIARRPSLRPGGGRCWRSYGFG
jgi:hypothetical protein